MSNDQPKRHLSRRRFVQCCAAAGAVGAIGAAGIYGAESAPLSAPLPITADARNPRTATLPVPDAPLLLIINERSHSPLSHYLAEILRAEGLNAFQIAYLDQLDLAYLSRFAIALLGEGPLTNDQRVLVEQYVTGGGRLIAMRPDQQLSHLLGVVFLGSQSTGGYLRTQAHPVTNGITTSAIQFHGPALHLQLGSAEALAWLQVDGAPQGLPAITRNVAGAGLAALWAFDLAESIVLTRQGNPESIGQERDRLDGLRTTDLFVDWVDLDRLRIPQADEQQRLLVNLIQELCASPLPRLWYFPANASAALIATGDAHGSNTSYIADVFERVERYGGRMSVYYTPQMGGALRRIARKARWWASDLPVVGDLFEPEAPLPGPSDIAGWRARGHEFGMHPYIEGGLAQGYHEYWTQFVKLGYGGLVPTVRTHRVLWNGWIDNVRVQSTYGVRMNLDYYHVGPAVRKPDGEWVYGYLTGSGLPMRFIDQEGALLPVYQQHTHLVDEHLMNVFDTGFDVGLDATQAIAVSTRLLQESVEQFPAALGLQCHIDPFLLGGVKAEQVGRWLEGTLEYAAAHHMLVLSAQQWLGFTEGRRDTAMQHVQWDATQRRLLFELAVPATMEDSPYLLLPLDHAGMQLQGILVDGQETSFEKRTLAGIAYAAVPAQNGHHTIQAAY